ncbi:MAG: alpha-L-arabinofuranosidase C-terminal domain-containing protein [Candidatus Ornithomonoglobus sp.]
MKIKIDTKKKLTKISPLFYGIFFEDINYAGDGGLYGELIANRSFEYYDYKRETDKHKMCWNTVGAAELEIKSDTPINSVHTHYAVINGSNGSGIRNTGFCADGFAVRNGDKFRFSCFAAADSEISLLIRITDSQNVYGETKININNKEWQKYEEEIAACGECNNAFLEILLTSESSVRIEFISLFNNDTFRGRKNGLRKDLAQAIEALSPKFVRFPGGCIVEGRSFENMYNWKDTVGPVHERRTNWNRWQLDEYQLNGKSSADYFQSYGLGFYEYFLFCEDLGAEPVPVINAGMTCQWHEGLLADMSELDSWIQDALDLVEFANGDTSTDWGRVRAQMGRAAPFNLKYLAIGNEQWGNEYFKRYEAFERVLSEKHPEIKLITSAGWTIRGDDYDCAVKWMTENKDKAYAVDEHFYKLSEWFFGNIHRYDSFDRTMPKVFAGEYAAHSSTHTEERRNTWECALAEAAFLTGAEKNSDHVIMTCYAPLLAKKDHQQWQPNLIWFDNTDVYLTPSYHVQKLFSRNIGGYIVNAECDTGMRRKLCR